MHFDGIREGTGKSFWENFGYKYVGALTWAYGKTGEKIDSDVLNQRFSLTEDESNYIIREVLSLY